MRHRILWGALGLAASLVCIATSTAAAQWPTTCVAANDAFEALHGNYANIGIYQRTFGEQAEQACRHDHHEDVRRAFAWALGEQVLAPSVPESPSVPPGTAVDIAQVRDVAIARGQDESTAEAIALAVVTNGDVEAYLQGTLPAVPSGAYPCSQRSRQCPLAPHQDFEVANWTWEKIQINDMCWKITTKLDIVNYLSEWLQFAWIDILIIYGDGYVIDRIATSDFNVAPNSTGRLSVFKDVCGSLGPSITNLGFDHKRL